MKKKEIKDIFVHRIFTFDRPLSERLNKVVPHKGRSRFVREAVTERLDVETK